MNPLDLEDHNFFLFLCSLQPCCAACGVNDTAPLDINCVATSLVMLHATKKLTAILGQPYASVPLKILCMVIVTKN